MKIAAHSVADVLKGSSRFIGILLHGEDSGRVRDHVMTATKAVVGPRLDPFRTSVLTREEHSRLKDEVSSRSLGGGRRVIRVQDATDGLAAVLDGLGDYREDALLLVEAGALTPRSKLRMMAETHPHWAAIAVYGETGAALSGEIRRILDEAGLAVEPSALAYLTSELGGDANRRRGELEKLALYAADDGTVTLEVAQACCSVSLDATLGEAVSAALAGRVERCDALLEELARDGASGPGVLAVFANQLQRVLKVRLGLDSGRSAEEACRGLQPPVFPRQMPGFMQEVQRWSTPRLEALGRAVRDADIACKRAASPDFAIAGRVLSVVAGQRPPRR
jgi:DNA polymerase-3 subunit delta